MKRKQIKAAVAMGLCLSICLTGCEETPEEVIVKEKGADQISKYESDEKTERILRETLGAPEHYANKASYENGVLVIDTDADVVLPEVSAIDTVTVSAKEMSQELIDTVTKAFFDGDKIYNAWSYKSMTKDQIQEKITLLKKYKAEGNLDPYDYGKDEEGNLQYDIDSQIEYYETQYEEAPEEVQKEEVTPAFGLIYPNGGEGETTVLEDAFDGVAETENGNYDYRIQDMGEMANEITFKIDKIREAADTQEFSGWIEGESFRDPAGEQYLSDEFVQELAGISHEEAEKEAVETVERLGWGLELYGWDYAVYYHGEEGVKESTCLDAGYQFYFTRKIGGIPITSTSEWGGGLEDMESTIVPWGYEVCNVIVGDDGIQSVTLYNPYKIGEVQTANVKLMDFDSIIQIYEQMMEVKNADISAYEKQRTYHINKIILGYSRIYDPNVDNTTGLLVPVWDFFGGFECESKDGYTFYQSALYSTQSFMTINAIDGTIIDRGLGY